jgi:hypothetical protein
VSGLADVYLLYQTEYYKLQAGQPFSFLFSQLGTRTASGIYNNTVAISSNVMVVAVNPDSQNTIVATVVQQSLVGTIAYFFPYYTWGLGATSGVMFFCCFTTMFMLFLTLFSCLLYDCCDDARVLRKKRIAQQEYHRIPEDQDTIHSTVNKIPQKQEVIVETIEKV